MRNYLFLLLSIPLFMVMTVSVKAQQVISQNNSLSIGIGVGITCNEGGLSNGGGIVKETHFYRYFDLPNDHGITNGFSVSSVQFGILWFISGGSGYPITINIYSASIGTFPSVTQTLQGTATYIASGNEMFTLVDLDLAAEIPAGQAMVMEMVLPEDGVTNPIPGFNLMGDSAPTFISADYCEFPTPVTLESISPDFENLAIVFAVIGDSCDPVDVPYFLDFESAIVPDIPVCTEIENAGDGNNWETYSGINGEFTGQYLKYDSHSANAANAWFYTKGINLVAGNTYKISYDYGSASSPVNLKVAYGASKNHNDMVNVLAEHIEVVSETNVLTNTVEFNPPSSGVYYFGFNAFSPADQGELYVDNVSVELSEDNSDHCSIEYPGQLNGALGDLQQLIIAADFNIEADTAMEIEKFVVNIFGNITDATIYFYQDSGGQPGNLIHTFNSLVPNSQTYIGTSFGYFVYENLFELPETLQLDGGNSGKTYWIGLETTAGSQGVPNAWEKEDSFHGYLPYYSNDGGVTWNVDTNNMDLAFDLSGQCGALSTNDWDSSDFTYYPNPAENVLNINSQKAIKSVEVFDMSGQNVLKTEKIQNGQINIDVLKSGVYIFRVMLEDRQVETFKIIKK